MRSGSGLTCPTPDDTNKVHSPIKVDRVNRPIEQNAGALFKTWIGKLSRLQSDGPATQGDEITLLDRAHHGHQNLLPFL